MVVGKVRGRSGDLSAITCCNLLEQQQRCYVLMSRMEQNARAVYTTHCVTYSLVWVKFSFSEYVKKID